MTTKTDSQMSRSVLAAELQAAYERIEELEDAIRQASDVLRDEIEDEETDADEGDPRRKGES